MIRLVELALFAAPLGIYLLWRTTIRRGLPGPSRQMLIAIFAGLLVLGGGLVWASFSDRHPGSSHYIPAQLQDGRIVPGHGA